MPWPTNSQFWKTRPGRQNLDQRGAYGALDIYAAMILSWRPAAIDLRRDHPRLARLEAGVWADPTVSAAFHQHQLAAPASDAA